MTDKKKPFCPKCGNKDNVQIHSSDFGSWKCNSCKIRFEYSKLSKQPSSSYTEKKQDLINYVLDPTLREGIPILDPSKKVYFENIKKDKFRLTGDEESINSLINIHDIIPKLLLGIKNKEINKKGRIKLIDGTIENIDF